MTVLKERILLFPYAKGLNNQLKPKLKDKIFPPTTKEVDVHKIRYINET